MTVTMFRGKIHRARVTEADLHYEGSITIDSHLLKASGILPYEKVQVVNVQNGARLETYTIPGEWGSGVIKMNGPAARLATVGDQVIIIAYGEMSLEEARRHKPRVVIVEEHANTAKDVFSLDVSLYPDVLPDDAPPSALDG